MIVRPGQSVVQTVGCVGDAPRGSAAGAVGSLPLAPVGREGGKGGQRVEKVLPSTPADGRAPGGAAQDAPRVRGPRKRREAAAPVKPRLAVLTGFSFDSEATPPAAAPKPKKAPRPCVKNDPRLIAAARELRDRWLEHVNAGPSALAGEGKYDVSRRIDSWRSPPRLGPFAWGDGRVRPRVLDQRPIGNRLRDFIHKRHARKRAGGHPPC
jgi:hypothetical protein